MTAEVVPTAAELDFLRRRREAGIHTYNVRVDRVGAGVEALSDREKELLQLVAEGLSNKEIGGRLGLSHLTVKSHLARIGSVLAQGDRAGMVAIALRAGAIT